MKKSKFFSKTILMTGVMSILLIMSCTKEDLPSPILKQNNHIETTIPDGMKKKMGSTLSASDKLTKSISQWNKHFGYSVQGVSSQYIGEIMNEPNRQSIVAAITDESAWAPYGNVDKWKTVSAKQLKYSTYDSYQHFMMVDSMLETGHSLYTIQWTKGGKNFSSLAVFDGDELVYDNMLTNTMIPESKTPVSTPTSGPGYDCFDPGQGRGVWAKWLWGSKRGEAKIDVTLDCECETGDCEVFTTIENNKAWFHIGSGEATVKWLDSPDKDRCVKYAGILILKGPTAKVSYTFDVKIGKFDIKIEGIGTHYTRQFTNTLCCETTGCQI